MGTQPRVESLRTDSKNIHRSQHERTAFYSGFAFETTCGVHPHRAGCHEPSWKFCLLLWHCLFAPNQVRSQIFQFYTSNFRQLTLLFSDPFAGWPGSVGGVPSTGVSDYFASQATPAGITPGLIQAASNILASPDRVSGAQHQGSLDHHGYPTISPRLTPSNAPGRLQYPLSGSQTGPSLDQYQYSPTRAQAALSQSQYPLSPDLIGSGSGNLSIDSHARYSPSREGGTIPYSPEQSFLNQMVAELEGRQAANTPSHGYSIGPDVHTSSVQAPSSGLAQAPEASQLPLPGTPNRASLGMQPRRSLIVEGVPRETEHASIVHLFPVSCIAYSNMG
jgi:hypothetical protein